jgi:hypothetical protein
VKVRFACGGEYESDDLEGNPEHVVCSKGCKHPVDEVLAAMPLIVAMPCGGTLDANAFPKDAKSMVCSKGCSHDLKQVADAVVGGFKSETRYSNLLFGFGALVLIGAGLIEYGSERLTFHLLHRDWTLGELFTMAGCVGVLYALASHRRIPKA